MNMRDLLELISMVAAPTTLATALLYWFGLELVDARSSYFGLGTGTLGFSTVDYLVRGVDAGIVPLMVLLMLIALAVIALVAGHRLTERHKGTFVLRWLVRCLFALALGVTASGIYAVFRPLPSQIDWYLLPPALLATGPVMLAYTAWLLNPRLLPPGPTRIVVISIAGLTILSAFWGASFYADALGRGRAEALAKNLTTLARVTLYSERSLGIAPDVATLERGTDEQDSAYPFRYSGLRLLLRSDDKYFILPDAWAPATGTILVIPDDSNVRVELSPPGA